MPKVILGTENRKRAKLEARWKKEDEELLARIGAWRAVTGATLEELGRLAGIKRGTMYNRIREPQTMTLGEWRRIRDVIGGENNIC